MVGVSVREGTVPDLGASAEVGEVRHVLPTPAIVDVHIHVRRGSRLGDRGRRSLRLIESLLFERPSKQLAERPAGMPLEQIGGGICLGEGSDVHVWITCGETQEADSL